MMQSIIIQPKGGMYHMNFNSIPEPLKLHFFCFLGLCHNNIYLQLALTHFRGYFVHTSLSYPSPPHSCLESSLADVHTTLGSLSNFGLCPDSLSYVEKTSLLNQLELYIATNVTQQHCFCTPPTPRVETQLFNAVRRVQFNLTQLISYYHILVKV